MLVRPVERRIVVVHAAFEGERGKAFALRLLDPGISGAAPRVRGPHLGRGRGAGPESRELGQRRGDWSVADRREVRGRLGADEEGERGGRSAALGLRREDARAREGRLGLGAHDVETRDPSRVEEVLHRARCPLQPGGPRRRDALELLVAGEPKPRGRYGFSRPVHGRRSIGARRVALGAGDVECGPSLTAPPQRHREGERELRDLGVGAHGQSRRGRSAHDVDRALGDGLLGPRHDDVGRGLGAREGVRERDLRSSALREGRGRREEREAERAWTQCGPTTRSSNDPGTAGGRGRAVSAVGEGGGPNFAVGR